MSHDNITIAVPTRGRLHKLNNFIESVIKNTDNNKIPFLSIINDAPENPTEPSNLIQLLLGRGLHEFNVTANLTKKGLGALWNDCIINSPTDWVLICNDDIVLKNGWLEYLEQQIASKKFKQIIIAHYGGMCIHKSLIPYIGWFEERFMGGGFEDVDWQLRISEALMKDVVDISHDFTGSTSIDPVRGWCHDFGPFAEHFKINEVVNGKSTGWDGKNNAEFMKKKWGREDLVDWSKPSHRKIQEIDWHPFYTILYSQKFGITDWFNSKESGMFGICP